MPVIVHHYNKAISVDIVDFENDKTVFIGQKKSKMFIKPSKDF